MGIIWIFLFACGLTAQVVQPNSPGALVVDSAHTKLVDNAAISPDGKFGASLGYDDQLKIWDLSTRSQLWTFSVQDSFSGMAFRPNSTMLAVGQRGGKSALIDYSKGTISTIQCGIADDQSAIVAVRFSSDGRYLACGDMKRSTVGVTDLESSGEEHGLQLYSTSTVPADLLSKIAFAHHKQQLAVAFFKGKVVLYDLQRNTNSAACVLDRFKADAVAFGTDDHLLVTGTLNQDKEKEGDFIVYDCDSRRVLAKTNKFLSGYSGFISFSEDGRYLAASGIAPGQAKLKIWNLSTNSEQDVKTPNNWPFGPVDINDAGQAVFVDTQNAVYFLPTPKVVMQFDASPVRHISSLKFLNNGDLFVSRDQGASQWDFTTGERAGFNIFSGKYSADESRFVYFGGKNYLEFYDSRLRKNFNTHVQASRIANLDVDSTGQSVVWTETQQNHTVVKVVKLSDPNPKPSAVCEVESYVYGMSFFAGSSLIVPCGVKDNIDIQVTDIASLEVKNHIRVQEAIISYCLSNDGSTMAIATGKGVTLYDLHGRDAPSTLIADAPYGRQVVGFSRDNKTLALTLRKDNSSVLEFWDVTSKVKLSSVTTDSQVSSIAFGKKVIAAGSLDGSITVWSAQDKQKLVTLLDCGVKDWLTIDTAGQFDGTGNALRWVGWRQNNQIKPLESYFTAFYTPGLLFNILQEIDPHEISTKPESVSGILPGDETTPPADQWTRPPSESVVVHLLAVGVGKYKDESVFHTLDYSASDAAAFEKSFKDAFHVPLINRLINVPPAQTPMHVWADLHDDRATRDRILDEIEYIGKISKPEDILVIYLSGHGYVPSGSQMFYFEPSDVRGITLDDQRKSAISTLQISDVLRNANAQRILLIIDACQSGEALNSLAKLAEIKQKSEQVKLQLRRVKTANAGIHILFAATPNEEAFSSSDYGHSLLTEAIIEAFSSQTKAHTSAKTLIEYVRKRLPEMAAKSHVQQTPMFESVGEDIPLWQILAK